MPPQLPVLLKPEGKRPVENIEDDDGITTYYCPKIPAEPPKPKQLEAIESECHLKKRCAQACGYIAQLHAARFPIGPPSRKTASKPASPEEIKRPS